MHEITLRTVRVFSNLHISDPEATLGLSNEVLSAAGISVIFNRSGPAELVVVLNVVRHPRWVLAPKERIIKVLQEPTIRNPLSHRFTYSHHRIFSKIFTHTVDTADARQVKSSGFHGSFVNLNERRKPGLEGKTELVSIVASTLDMLPGHKERVAFIEKLLTHRPDLIKHTFGKGRGVELERKSTGLLPYMYSIAIENTSAPSYITEKFIDCILTGTVPLYFGAPDIGTYFPEHSFIWLPIQDFDKCLEILEGLGPEDYQRREEAIIEAQSLIQSKLSLASMIIDELDKKTSADSGRSFHFLFSFDVVGMFIWDLAVKAAGLLPQNQRLRIWGVIQSLTGWKI